MKPACNAKVQYLRTFRIRRKINESIYFDFESFHHLTRMLRVDCHSRASEWSPLSSGRISTTVCPFQEADDNDQLGCTYWSEEDMGWETDGLVMGGLTSKPDATGIVMQCTVFHLSAFTSRESPSTTSWNTVDLLDGFGLIAEVSRAISCGLTRISCTASIQAAKPFDLRQTARRCICFLSRLHEHAFFIFMA